jgi:hypothetical protein
MQRAQKQQSDIEAVPQKTVQHADLSPLLLGVRGVPLGESHLALAADQEHEIDL